MDLLNYTKSTTINMSKSNNTISFLRKVKQFITQKHKEEKLSILDTKIAKGNKVNVNTLPLKEYDLPQHSIADYEQNVFLENEFNKFHENVLANDVTNTGECQCKQIDKALELLKKYGVKYENWDMACDCGENMRLPVPLNKWQQGDEERFGLLCSLLQQDKLDYLYSSVNSIPSFDQPGDGGCVLTALDKWSWDAGLREKINIAYKACGFAPLVKLCPNKLRLIMAIYSYAFDSGDKAYSEFDDVLKECATASDGFLTEIVNQNNWPGFAEWAQIAVAKLVSKESKDGPINVQKFANLKRDVVLNSPLSAGSYGATRFETYPTSALLEYLYPIKILNYNDATGLLVPTSDEFSIVNMTPCELSMKPIAILVIVSTEVHLDKTIVNPKHICYVKGRDKLPNFIVESVKRLEERNAHSAAELIHNWNDGKDQIFDFLEDESRIKQFKLSLRGSLISKLPHFNNTELPISENIAHSPFVKSPLSMVLEIAVKSLDPNLRTNEVKALKKFVSDYTQSTMLSGLKLECKEVDELLRTEIEFINKHRGAYFAPGSFRDIGIKNVIAETSNCKFSLFISPPNELSQKPSQVMKQIQNKNLATPKTAVHHNLPGIRKNLNKPAGFIRIGNRENSNICCSIFAMNRCSELLTDKNILACIDKDIPIMNNVGVSFGKLITVPAVHNNMSYEHLSIQTGPPFHSSLTLGLFSTMEPGVYWVQLQLNGTLNMPVFHVIVLNIIKRYDEVLLPNDCVATLEHNMGDIGIVEKRDIDKAISSKCGDSIIREFIQTDYSVQSVTRMFVRSSKDSTYSLASNLHQKYEGRRITRQASRNITDKINNTPPTSSIAMIKLPELKSVQGKSASKRKFSISNVAKEDDNKLNRRSKKARKSIPDKHSRKVVIKKKMRVEKKTIAKVTKRFAKFMNSSSINTESSKKK